MTIARYPIARVPIAASERATQVVVSTPLPMQLSGFLTTGASSLPMRLTGQTASGPASLPMRLTSASSSDFTTPTLTWTAQVVIDNTDYSAMIADAINITHREDSSNIADFVLIPPAGPIDLATYERKRVHINFIGGSISVRRFTGLTASAEFDPDSGRMTISCTSDLQGTLENMERPAIDNLIGGLWSEWVFDETADGYQYAQDQLSTTQSEIHHDEYRNLVVVPWAAKVTPDIELTDSGRFNNSLSIERANLRDLLTRFRVNLDFRFTRLRHREITARFLSQRGFCDYLNNNWIPCEKDMVRQAADAAQWTRQNEITFEEIPGPLPSVCSPPRAWGGGAEDYCLGAYWKAARRWAQTITEQYAIDIVSTDMETNLGRIGINADYGIEATFDATDYEAQQDFIGPPAGSTYNPKTFDWEIDADQSVTDGRAAMDIAQQAAMEAGKSEILARARSNRVGLSNIYDPTIGLDKTIRINTPYLKATGKVAQINETMNPVTGDLSMALELAISRRGGSGLGPDDPLDPAPVPEQPQEINTGRTYDLPYRMGATTGSPPDDETWDGYMTNVGTNGQDYIEGAETYRIRFVVGYPEIEETARDELSIQSPTTYEIIVPQDELEIGN